MAIGPDDGMHYSIRKEDGTPWICVLYKGQADAVVERDQAAMPGLHVKHVSNCDCPHLGDLPPRINLVEKYPPSEFFNSDEVEEFCKGYIECALWSSSDESEHDEYGNPKYNMDDNYGIDDLNQKTFDELVEECKDFMDSNQLSLRLVIQRRDYKLSQGGHDFWLTRNHHGAGYWDRGLGAAGETLTKASHAYGGCYCYVGDDGEVYFQ